MAWIFAKRTGRQEEPEAPATKIIAMPARRIDAISAAGRRADFWNSLLSSEPLGKEWPKPSVSIERLPARTLAQMNAAFANPTPWENSDRFNRKMLGIGIKTVHFVLRNLENLNQKDLREVATASFSSQDWIIILHGVDILARLDQFEKDKWAWAAAFDKIEEFIYGIRSLNKKKDNLEREEEIAGILSRLPLERRVRILETVLMRERSPTELVLGLVGRLPQCDEKVRLWELAAQRLKFFIENDSITEENFAEFVKLYSPICKQYWSRSGIWRLPQNLQAPCIAAALQKPDYAAGTLVFMLGHMPRRVLAGEPGHAPKGTLGGELSYVEILLRPFMEATDYDKKPGSMERRDFVVPAISLLLDLYVYAAMEKLQDGAEKEGLLGMAAKRIERQLSSGEDWQRAPALYLLCGLPKHLREGIVATLSWEEKEIVSKNANAGQ